MACVWTFCVLIDHANVLYHQHAWNQMACVWTFCVLIDHANVLYHQHAWIHNITDLLHTGCICTMLTITVKTKV